MPFVWGSLAIGDKVLYSASVQLDEMRDNVDWLDDHLANGTYNGTIHATADAGWMLNAETIIDNTADLNEDSSDNNTVDATADLGEDSTLNSTIDATADLGYDGSLLTGQLSSQNSPVNSTNYPTNYPTDYATYCACNSK
jgi:hypothetical protein